jgi:outer membrane protein OmpA-like peptidoglycan-associated protein
MYFSRKKLITSLPLLLKKHNMRIAMNKMSHTPALYRLGPVLLLCSLLIVGCADSPTEYRYNDSIKAYTTTPDDKTTTSTISQHNKTTAHYILRPGNRPDIQPRLKPATTATDQAGLPVTQASDLQMVLEVSDILFDFDRWVIKQSVVPELDRWADYFLSNPQVTAEIYGHADSTGPSAYNENLSYKRAQAVINYLVNKGVDAKRLTAKGFGESQPVAPNTTSEGRQKNRRVELNL